MLRFAMKGRDFPATRHFPASFNKYDEIYQAKDWSRADVNVLLSLDPSKLDYKQPAHASYGPRLCCGVVEDVWQGAGLLLHAGTHKGGVDGPGHSYDVF